MMGQAKQLLYISTLKRLLIIIALALTYSLSIEMIIIGQIIAALLCLIVNLFTASILLITKLESKSQTFYLLFFDFYGDISSNLLCF